MRANLSSAQAYAVQFLQELRRRGGIVSSAVLAEASGISIKSVHGVMFRLVKTGLVARQMGPGGGYRLADPRYQASILDVIDALPESGKPSRISDKAEDIQQAVARKTRKFWGEILYVDDL